jgi:uncharacterized protein YkwD
MTRRHIHFVIAVLLGAVFITVPAQKKTTTKPTTPPRTPAVVNSPPVKAPATANAAIKLLSSKEKETIEEINFARQKPAEFLKLLQEFRALYHGKEIHFPDGRVLVTGEGVAALDDAINFVRSVKPLPPYELSQGLIKAAKIHVLDMVTSNRDGHTGSDGSKPTDRISRFGTWQDSVGENIIYDSQNTKYDVILMAIDDGTANRGHRRNLFKTEFRVIGIAMGQRLKAEIVGVITFAGGFVEKR